ncbi:MAG: META domain-containing protein [Thermomicrobiales bacterium]
MAAAGGGSFGQRAVADPVRREDNHHGHANTSARELRGGHPAAPQRWRLRLAMTLLSLVLFLALTPLLTTHAAPAAAAPGIPPHVWEMDSFTLGNDAPVDVGDPERYSAQFLPDGRAQFRLDCNRGQADYAAADGHVALAVFATTDALCPSGSYSEAFATLLMSAEGYRFDDTGNLILRGPEGALRLRPALTGVTWHWQGIADNEGGIFVAPPAPARYTLEFLADGSAAIRADCNRARARVRTNGAALAIRLGGVTHMACHSGSLGGLYLSGLANVEYWYLFNGVLTLSLPDSAGMMIFGPVASAGAIPAGAD